MFLRDCLSASRRAAIFTIDDIRRPRASPLLSTLLTAASVIALSAGAALADDQTKSSGTSSASSSSGTSSSASQGASDATMKKLEAMEHRIKSLEADLKKKKAADAMAASNVPPDSKFPGPAPKNKDLFGVAESPVPGLSIGMYGEIKFGRQQNPNANGQWQNGFDTGRIVLLPSYQFSDNIIFNAEIEFEHAGSGFDNDDKLHGTAEIEQAYVDFKFNDYFNWRSPGVDIVPISFNNLYHEPTLFYSVNRPELANGLIPTTWVAPSTAIYGKIVDGLTYELQVSQSLEDFGDDFAHRNADGTPVPGGYAAGVDGINALGFAHAPLGGFAQLNDSVAVTGRLAYSPSFIPGFAGSSAVYYSPNIEPRGAYDFNGNPLGKTSVSIFDTEFRYRPPNTGFEFRGEFAYVNFGNPENLRANNDGDGTNNVGKSMYGWSAEVAYHFNLGTILNTQWEAVPFYRYTYQNLQTSGFAGLDADTPTGQGQTTFHTFGVAVFPTPKLVLKATYQKVLNKDPMGANSDSFLGAVGFLF